MSARRKHPAHVAAESLSDLNMVAAITVLCEHSLLTTPSGQRFARRVIALCVTERRRQFRTYEKAVTTLRAQEGE